MKYRSWSDLTELWMLGYAIPTFPTQETKASEMTDDLQQCIQSESSSYYLFKGMYAVWKLGSLEPFIPHIPTVWLCRPSHNAQSTLLYLWWITSESHDSAQGPSGETATKTKEKMAPVTPWHKLLPSSQAAMAITRQG